MTSVIESKRGLRFDSESENGSYCRPANVNSWGQLVYVFFTHASLAGDNSVNKKIEANFQ